MWRARAQHAHGASGSTHLSLLRDPVLRIGRHGGWVARSAVFTEGGRWERGWRWSLDCWSWVASRLLWLLFCAARPGQARARRPDGAAGAAAAPPLRAPAVASRRGRGRSAPRHGVQRASQNEACTSPSATMWSTTENASSCAAGSGPTPGAGARRLAGGVSVQSRSAGRLPV